MKRIIKRWIFGYFFPAFCAAFLYLILVFGYIIPDIRGQMLEMKKENIKFLAQSIWSILSNYENRVSSGELILETAQTRALNHISHIRYGSDGKDYFWIHGTDLIMKMHPYVTELNGKSLREYRDSYGNYLFVEMCKTVEQYNEGYVKYYWQFKDSPLEKHKESFVKIFRPWGWVIGTGVYYDDIEEAMHPFTQKVITYSLGIFVAILLLLIWITGVSFQSEQNRIRIEQENIYAAQKYRATFETAGTAMFIVDNSAFIQQINQKFSIITGYTEAEIKEKPFISFIPADMQGQFDSFFNEQLSQNNVSKQHNTKLLTKDNRILDVIINMNPMGQFQNIASFLDITELKETYEKLNSETFERSRAEDQLRQTQKMETIGTLAGGIAHDFNNILSGIIGTISVIKYMHDSDEKISEQEMKDYISTIDDSAMRASELVRQLLTLSRKSDLNVTSVNIKDIIEQVVKICQNTFEKTVELKIFSSDIIFSADRNQIEQVILNLCINACHAMTIMKPNQKQGGIIRITTDTVYADNIFCENHPEASCQQYCLISISDTGVGIPKNLLSKIFDPFFTTKDTNKGTGLGLSMVYNIIRQHSGFIDVYSEPKLGTTFNVYIPITSNFPRTEPTNEIIPIIKGSGTILIVDDETIVRYTAQKMLELCGYSVLTAEDGLVGLEKFKMNQDKISLVLLDMIMPRMSGRDCYNELKKISPTVPIVLASGFRQDTRIEHLVQSGLKYFIHKPYTIERLSQIVHAALHSQLC